jgi:hypothetical protein
VVEGALFVVDSLEASAEASAEVSHRALLSASCVDRFH